MTTYTISSRTACVTLGHYQADSPAEALEALARDSGYQDHAEACREMAGRDELELSWEFLPGWPCLMAAPK